MKKLILLFSIFFMAISCSNGNDDSEETCTKPGNINLSNLTSTSFIVAWDDKGETAWEVEFGLAGFQLGTGTTLQTSNTSQEVLNLTPSTTYELYVRANCGSAGFSDYSGPIVITTNQ